MRNFSKNIKKKKIIQWHFHSRRGKESKSGRFVATVRTSLFEENDRSIDQGGAAAVAWKIQAWNIFSIGWIDVVGRNTFSVSVSGAACRPGSHETTPPPIHPRPPRNANSAIEFSGILPDDQTDAVELNFAATPCRYTRALPSPPIPTHVSFQRRASLIPLSASLDIFHWTRGGELAANP